ncbi:MULTISPECIES: genetic competence negative regulator [Brevibacillus]|jgi:adapter protein MecA 1/2|uniref:Adapter protein MecA n=1 Tax=Brevibacillus borstelensis AK1 TaxID=1300222 RepID=M8EDU6_9BACL|nr:genetic competence negative regulator [Brevibacillus borstelensis]EMT53630.1 adaptor protein [Brevibacillus borstelensis AK1]KKX52993.1 adaptor protein [Brevibacillus borstelensis cifa_chp40]MBE5397760.1 genetic competence negative regulator [Brevibacillus borstelensis]MCC0562697.1 genetic competence negative regulator [Brevibacillus borstelensis]MCM3469695.1 genetic competence negative regulator [Brevibacillus borstelensis]
MRVERLGQDKIRIFLTFDDLSERGIEKEDMWRDIPKVHELFNDMMEQAYQELGFEVSGPVAVEVFALPAQGMVVIVTRGKTGSKTEKDEEEYDEDDVYELEVTLEESDLVIYSFRDFEHLVEAAHRINAFLINGGAAYFYQGKYYLVLEELDLDQDRYQKMIAILSEYGEATPTTVYVLEEYGKVVVADDAVKEICRHFT